MHSLYGEIAVADSRAYLHTYNEETGAGILQVCETSLTKVLASAALIHKIGGTMVSFVPKKTSGTIRALLKKLTDNHRNLINGAISKNK